MAKKKAKKKPKKKAKAKAKAKKKGKVKAKVRKQAKGPKVIGQVEHYFGKIFVAAMKCKAPLQVGDYIHIKGATTDYTQKIESMQINHKEVTRARKGQDVGFRVRGKCRVGDTVFVAAKDKAVVQFARPTVAPISFNRPMPPKAQPIEQLERREAKPVPQARPPQQRPSADPYSDKKFMSF